ncbi:RNA polymerase-binding transcription factor CarD [bioreactor metagenome]|uniref:RNA polymerase-binding transcription factor CarD n=1 Tax=bioreactor metagenome TaxID=1076179 RepID=A0A645BQY0_9ZZZZ|nr:CarD family transcriptional regulator [Lutispora sp.]MEA4961696.1 CarD family transcriptional regulator [Lutispora sp.]HCJ58044.1 CarD family transcriptional regulator [Clostridiaceae bacterium]
MFHVGDKVVYPMHGAGIIESIEDREVFCKRSRYYIIKMILGQIKVMVPIDKAGAIGIRKITDMEGYDQVMRILSGNYKIMDKKWNKRYRENEAKLKEGNINDIAEIVNYLNYMNKKGKLSTGEKKMLVQSRQMLVSELALIKNVCYEEMERDVDKILNICEL